MALYVRIPTLVLSAVMLVVQVHAQPVVSDSFQVYMKGAWKQVREAASRDSLQKHYGQTFFDYHQQHPHTKVGQEAGWQAFLMWSNAGAAAEIDGALGRLSDDSELWSSILQYVKEAYSRSAHRDSEAFYALLTGLERRLTHPASRSAVLYYIALRQQEHDRQDEAQRLFQEIVNLNAHPFFVRQALGGLHEMASLNLGQVAPSFVRETVSGEVIELEALRGKYVLVEFWATWCGPCLSEIPRLKALSSAYRDLQIISVALQGDGEAVTQFIQEQEMAWPQIVERAEFESELARLYNVAGIPSSYLIGPDGTIVAKHLRGEELEQELRRLMEQ